MPLAVAFVGVFPLLAGRQVRRSTIEKDLDILAKLPAGSRVRAGLQVSIELRIDEMIDPPLKRGERFWLAWCVFATLTSTGWIVVALVVGPRWHLISASVSFALSLYSIHQMVRLRSLRQQVKRHRQLGRAGVEERPPTPEPADLT